jgi:preprotein translocase subunit SecE
VAKADKKVAHKQPNAVQRYLRETIGELRKVTWPTRQEAINLTIVVLIVIMVMSSFLGTLDVVFSRFFAFILGG